jgi:hypothetical protein
MGKIGKLIGIIEEKLKKAKLNYVEPRFNIFWRKLKK